MDATVPATTAATPVQDAKKKAAWTFASGRVQVAIWSHPQATGTRYTINVFRQYFSHRDNAVKRGSFFDRQDLGDVKRACDAADAYLASLSGPEADA